MKLTFKRGAYLAFVLDDDSRDKLLAARPPAHKTVRCHHVTVQFKIKDQDALDKLTAALSGKVVATGYTKTKKLDLFTVEVGGKRDRPIEGFYHVTSSTADGVKPAESNDVLDLFDGQPAEKLDHPITLTGQYELCR